MQISIHFLNAIFQGAPGLGKTQFCQQLALSNTTSERNSRVLYIDTEGAFSAQRLLRIGLEKFELDSRAIVEDSLSKVVVWRPDNVQEILDK